MNDYNINYTVRQIIILTALFYFTTSLYCLGQNNIKILLAGKTDGNISINEIHDAKRITLSNDSIKITSFNITGVVNGFFREVSIKTDSFSQESYELINKLVGKHLYIENVKGKKCDNMEINFGSAKFFIIDK